jgi:hypothetical protein
VSEEGGAAPVWHPALRVVFRIGFVYLAVYALANGNLTLLPLPSLTRALAWPWATAAQAWGPGWFHLSGTAARWHGGGSGDLALDYVRILLFAATALAAGAIWSALDWRRPHYRTLLGWLRLLLRLTAGLTMLGYGLAKVFPMQMRLPSEAILSNTYGNSSPMTLLWTMVGLHPAYEAICGAAEVLGGVLLLIRRTAALGALVSLAVMANVVLYNFFFDVPVKIFSVHVELMCAVLLLPDLPPLWQLFVRGRPAQLRGTWVPSFSSRPARIGLVVAEWAFLGLYAIGLTVIMALGWRDHLRAQEPAPILGAWSLQSVDGGGTGPLSPEGQPLSALYLDDRRQGFYRPADGALWRCVFSYDPAKHQLRIGAMGSGLGLFEWAMPDPDHLVLTRQRKNRAPLVLELKRLPAPPSYFLVTRGFHWVNEWGYER